MTLPCWNDHPVTIFGTKGKLFWSFTNKRFRLKLTPEIILKDNSFLFTSTSFSNESSFTSLWNSEIAFIWTGHRLQVVQGNVEKVMWSRESGLMLSLWLSFLGLTIRPNPTGYSTAGGTSESYYRYGSGYGVTTELAQGHLIETEGWGTGRLVAGGSDSTSGTVTWGGPSDLGGYVYLPANSIEYISDFTEEAKQAADTLLGWLQPFMDQFVTPQLGSIGPVPPALSLMQHQEIINATSYLQYPILREFYPWSSQVLGLNLSIMNRLLIRKTYREAVKIAWGNSGKKVYKSALKNKEAFLAGFKGASVGTYTFGDIANTPVEGSLYAQVSSHRSDSPLDFLRLGLEFRDTLPLDHLQLVAEQFCLKVPQVISSIFTIVGHGKKEFLNLFPLNKRLRIILSFDQSLMEDTVRQYCKFRKPEDIPESVRDMWPNGLELPSKFKDLKDLHDQISAEHLKIEAARDRAPILYTKLAETLHGLQIGDFKIALAKTSGDLVLWGGEMHNCIGSYRDKAQKSESILFAVYKNDKLEYNVEIRPAANPISYILGQFKGPNNSNPKGDDHIVVMKGTEEHLKRTLEPLIGTHVDNLNDYQMFRRTAPQITTSTYQYNQEEARANAAELQNCGAALINPNQILQGIIQGNAVGERLVLPNQMAGPAPTGENMPIYEVSQGEG